MKRRILGLVLMVSIFAAFLPYVNAATIIASGNCGTYNYDTQDFDDNANWVLDSDGTLTISGNGYIGLGWAKKQSSEINEKIRKLVAKHGIVGIDSEAFSSCTNLGEIDITDDIEIIRAGAFYGTTWYENQNDGPVYIGTVFYMYKGAVKENTTLSIREGTTSISSTLSSLVHFDGPNTLGNITNISFPDSLLYIDARALDLTGWYKNQPNGVVYINDILYAYKGMMTESQEINIKDGTKTICEYAFHSGNGYPICDQMTAVYLPTSIKNIGRCAFLECDALTDLYYRGTKEQWGNSHITITNNDHGNDAIFNANIHFLGAVTPVPTILNSSTVEKQGGVYRVTAKLQDIPYDCDIAAALYSNGKLVGIETVPAIIGDDEKTFNITASSADTAKIFIWDSLGGMRPLCEAKTVDIK